MANTPEYEEHGFDNQVEFDKWVAAMEEQYENESYVAALTEAYQNSQYS